MISKTVEEFRAELDELRKRRTPLLGGLLMRNEYPHLMRADDEMSGPVLKDLGDRWRMVVDSDAVYMETREHKGHPEITFAIGISGEGKEVVKYVDYGKSLGDETVQRYAKNAYRMILAGECPHCKEE